MGFRRLFDLEDYATTYRESRESVIPIPAYDFILLCVFATVALLIICLSIRCIRRKARSKLEPIPGDISDTEDEEIGIEQEKEEVEELLNDKECNV